MTEDKPASVTEPQGTPKQAGETPSAMGWVDRSVWTERMLQRLAQSQLSTKWFALWDKVVREETLFNASLQVIVNHGSAGVDRQTTQEFQKEWAAEVRRLSEELAAGIYRPLPARRVYIEKPGSPELRPLGIPAVRDRVVQGALKSVLEPIFERDFVEHSYGFRPGKSAQQALARVEALLESGHTYIVDADLKGYFDSIPHDRLMKALTDRIADGSVLQLIQRYLDAGVLEEGKGWERSVAGTPQGSVISPLLANVYLHPLDVVMRHKGREMVRYADDFVVLCRKP
jgi:RNA-directed DNA polymerase